VVLQSFVAAKSLATAGAFVALILLMHRLNVPFQMITSTEAPFAFATAKFHLLFMRRSLVRLSNDGQKINK